MACSYFRLQAAFQKEESLSPKKTPVPINGLDTNLLREALEITLVDQAHQLVSPPLGDTIMDFVNQLDYSGEIHLVSRMAANLDSPTNKGKKTKPHVIPYYWFTKLIIYYLGRHHKIHQSSRSPLNLLKMISVLEISSSFPKAKLIKSLECVKKKTTPKDDKPVKPALAKQAKPRTAKQPKLKPVKEKSTKPTPLQKAGKGKVKKIYNVKRSLQLVEEPDEELDQHVPEPEPQGAATEEASIRSSAQPQDDTSANIVRETPTLVDAKTGVDTNKVTSKGDSEILDIGEKLGEDMDNKVHLVEQTAKLDEGQDRSDPGKTSESRPPPDDDKMDKDQAGSNPVKSHVALAGPNLEPMHDDFVATVYPQVHESLKHTTQEHVQMENLLSLIGTLSSMNNLYNFNFGDLFIGDKSPEDESGNANIDTKVKSMVTVLIYRASSLVPLLSTPVINLSPPKPISAQKFIATTTETTTTTLLPPPPPQQQSTTNSEIAARVTTLKKKFSKDRFRELPEADMKEILHQRMFKSAISYKDPEENKLLSKIEDIGSCIKWFGKRIGKKKLRKFDLEGPAFKVVKAFHENNISLHFQMEECHRLLTNKVDLVNPEGHRLMPNVGKLAALLISKLKATNYLDFGLEELVPSLWIKSECDYNISASYGITQWWFKRMELYITRHSAHSDHLVVRSYMWILSVISIKTFERYRYAYLREIIICRADYNKYKISEAVFKNLHPNDFEDLNIVIIQRVKDLQLGIESYQTKLNLTEPRWDTSNFLFKEDYTIVSKPTAVIYKDRNDQKKLLRENEPPTPQSLALKTSDTGEASFSSSKL
nr:hypothetical protein [Tanacetum cinerariifolium]